MLTGVPHAPMNVENANPGPPNDWPTLGAVVRRLARGRGRAAGGGPAADAHLQHRRPSGRGRTPGSSAGPPTRGCSAASRRRRRSQVPEFTLAADVPPDRLAGRRDLLGRLDRGLAAAGRRPAGRGTTATPGRRSICSARPTARGRVRPDAGAARPSATATAGTTFGQSCLLARRLVEAGVRLVQVNWFRGADEPADEPVLGLAHRRRPTG